MPSQLNSSAASAGSSGTSTMRDEELAIGASPSVATAPNQGAPDSPTSVVHDKDASANGPAPAAKSEDVRLVTWGVGVPSSSNESDKPGEEAVDPLSDPDNPQAWSPTRRRAILLVVSASSLCVTCASSVVASCYQSLEREFDISEEVAILGLSLFVIGLGLGPIFIAPLSEFYGRRPIYLISFGAFALLGLPVAFANNPAVFFIFRFITGFMGSAFLSVAGGTVTDLYTNAEVYLPMAIYSASPFAGPELGPLFSGFANYYTNSFRWTFWACTIWQVINWVAIWAFVPETFHPILLTKRARSLRESTGDSRYRSQHEISYASKTLSETLLLSMKRVPQLLVLEPMLFLLCLWSALLLGIIYLLFEAYPIVFVQGHGFNLWQVGLTFLGIAVGMLCGLASMPYWSSLYAKARIQHDGNAPPEARLPPAILGCFLTVIGLFMFAFTSYPHVHWIAPVISGAPFGAGVLLIFIAVFTFTTDAYRPVAASAMACNSVFRSSFAAGFPLFSNFMYIRLGTVGASCLLAGLNVLMIPVPFLFYKYGARIRAKSRFTLS